MSEDEMHTIRERQLAIVSIVWHLYENLFPYAILASLGSVVWGIAKSGDNREAFLDEVMGGQIAIGASLALIFGLIWIFSRLQSRREDIDLANHLADEADRSVPPPY